MSYISIMNKKFIILNIENFDEFNQELYKKINDIMYEKIKFVNILTLFYVGNKKK